MCDNSEDEELTSDCIEKLTKMKTIKPEATLVCTSLMYADKNMQTVAVACDGIVECHNEEDESWICTNSSLPVYGTLFICFLLLISLFGLKLFKGSFKEKNRRVGTFKSS